MPELTSQDVQMYLTVGTVMALAATLQSAMGFGFNLIAAPLLVYFFRDPGTVVPAMHISWLPVGLAICICYRNQINVSRVGHWISAAVFGLAAGVWLLADLDASVLRRVIGTVTVVAALSIAFKGHRPLRRERLWMLAAGGLSGVLGGSTAMSGPPLIILGLNQGWPTPGFRADLLVYFTVVSALALGMYAWAGLLTQTALHYAVAGAPGLCIGFLAGTAAARYVSGKRFRYAAIGLLCVVGVAPWLA